MKVKQVIPAIKRLTLDENKNINIRLKSGEYEFIIKSTKQYNTETILEEIGHFYLNRTKHSDYNKTIRFQERCYEIKKFNVLISQYGAEDHEDENDTNYEEEDTTNPKYCKWFIRNTNISDAYINSILNKDIWLYLFSVSMLHYGIEIASFVTDEDDAYLKSNTKTTQVIVTINSILETVFKNGQSRERILFGPTPVLIDVNF